jgi:DNA-directed RNA polymerase specialized sigma24 family protein
MAPGALDGASWRLRTAGDGQPSPRRCSPTLEENRRAGAVEPPPAGGSDGATTTALDARADLLGALGGLPARQRAVLVLRYFADLPEAEVAEILNCSVGTVKSSASRALERLRETPELTAARPAPSDTPENVRRTIP